MQKKKEIEGLRKKGNKLSKRATVDTSVFTTLANSIARSLVDLKRNKTAVKDVLLKRIVSLFSTHSSFHS